MEWFTSTTHCSSALDGWKRCVNNARADCDDSIVLSSTQAAMDLGELVCSEAGKQGKVVTHKRRHNIFNDLSPNPFPIATKLQNSHQKWCHTLANHPPKNETACLKTAISITRIYWAMSTLGILTNLYSI